ncbi:MAG: (Fe-S)-binding protein [Desulforhabdus sp.]|jgi:ArsR family metal-binding transcriptional regulator|nr:(Fe-S)-binding protein [Desulforhabdus sp.]
MKEYCSQRTGYRFHLVNIDCMPNSSNFNVVMDLDESVEELLPYLAAVLPGCTYVHGSDVINFMESGHIIALYPDRLTITDVRDHHDAESLCRLYYGKLHYVRTNRAAIEPVFEKRSSVGVLDILRALPKTNCGECGSASCMAFAARVFRRDAAITRCAPLLRDHSSYLKIADRLQANGYQT